MSDLFRKHRNELGLAIAVLVVVAITAALSDTYHSAAGRTETGRIIFREAAMLGIFALGAAVVIIAGGIDLSSGSIIAFSGTIFFSVLTRGSTLPASIRATMDWLIPAFSASSA